MAPLSAHIFLPGLHIAYVSALLPLHANMQRICSRSLAETWPDKRPVACHKTHITLPPLGRQRLRPRAMIPPLSQFKDIHTHGRTAANIVTSVEPDDELGGEYGTAWYSVGIHPWSTTEQIRPETIERLNTLAEDKRVVAIGEAGFDKNRGGSTEYQTEIFLLHVKLAETTGKPLIIHCVGRYGRLLELHRQLKPTRPWIIHGFSGKPELARQLVNEGFYFSLKSDAPARQYGIIPAERLFTETD